MQLLKVEMILRFYISQIYMDHAICFLFETMTYKSSQTLLYPYIQPDIMGRNNQIIEIKNQEETFKQALFLMDLNDYDYIHDDLVFWYEDNVKRLSAQYVLQSIQANYLIQQFLYRVQKQYFLDMTIIITYL